MNQEFLVFEVPFPDPGSRESLQLGVAQKLHLATWASLVTFVRATAEEGQGTSDAELIHTSVCAEVRAAPLGSLVQEPC